jgi:hypothetical protein
MIDEKALNASSEEMARKTWDGWLTELEDKDQPKECNIDNPDCEECGS